MKNVKYGKCVRCGKTYEATPDLTNCECGGILDIVYDYDYIKTVLTKEKLAKRENRSMWRYRELLPVEETTPDTPLRVGWSPLYEEPKLAQMLGIKKLWVKDDGQNPTASLKDRASAMAVAKAYEAGAKTILIEKFGHDMASGIRDTLAACGSKQQQEDGDDVNKKDAVRYLCNWSQGYTRRSLAQVWADRSGETMDWFTDVLAESGIDFRHEIDEKHDNDNYEVLDVGHSTQYGDEYSEQLTMDAVLKHAEADGLEVQYEITMVKLEKDGNRVTGLIAKNANDEYVRYNASKGVILRLSVCSSLVMRRLQRQ